MKRCPQCHSTFTDDSLLYCLQDGSALVPIAKPEMEAETLDLPSISDNATEGKNVGQNDIQGNISKPKPTPVKAGFMGDRRKRYAVLVGGVIVLALVSLAGYRLIKGSGAQKQFEEAQAIERSEGSLSQRACKKYKEIELNSLSSSAVSELERKIQDCTSVQNLFQAAEKLEGDKGLDHETAAAYRKVAEKFPGSAYDKRASNKTSEFERNKRAAIRAWDEFQEIDYKLLAFEVRLDLGRGGDPGPKLREYRNTLVEVVNDYGKILEHPDSENVDPRVISRIKEAIAINNQKAVVIDKFERDGADYVERARKKEAEISSESERIDHNIWVDQETKKLAKNYEEAANEVDQRNRALAQRDKDIASELEKKYKVEFLDRH